MRRQVKIGIFLNILLLIFAVFLWHKIFVLDREEPLVEVNFLDVGQGDSILIEMPNSNQMIIDGGPSRGIASKIVGELPPFDRKIEMVVLTHPDKDHITGLFEVFEVFEVERVLIPKIVGGEEEKPLYLKFKKAVEEEKSEIIYAKEGQRISFPGEVYFLIFWPPEGFSSRELNDFSIVGKLIFGKVRFLFTGDISEKVEQELVKENFNLRSDILKISHHGSKYSSSTGFLKSVTPFLALISVGKNNYGHPSKEALERLEKFGINFLRTDKEGDIKIITNGQDIKVY